jgi:tetratricopeptide (TPR) repeat protein/2-polyprenyl-3-methyl-5-hydroxy-6-metoxy-1,4-benzoquinol methylase
MNQIRKGFRAGRVLMVELPSGKKAPLPKARELAVIEHNAARFLEAEAHYKAILKVAPQDWWALNYLGEILNKAGNFALALGRLKLAARLNPAGFEAFNNMGNAQRGLGDFTAAIESYQAALKLKPAYVAAINNYALALKALGRHAEAEEQLRLALQLSPDLYAGWLNLASLLEEQQRLKEALACYAKAIQLQPNDFAVLGSWAQVFKRIAFLPYDEDIFKILSRWLCRPEAFVSSFARPTYRLLQSHPVFKSVLEQVCSDHWEPSLVYGEAAQRLSSIPLLMQIMGLSPAIDPTLETMFSRLRKAMLLSMSSALPGDMPPAPFSIALANFCFSNDYVFSESGQERLAVECVAEGLRDSIDAGQVSWSALVVLASYRPLYRFPWSGHLLSRALPEGLQVLIRQQVAEPVEELRVRSEIPELGRIDHEVSREVQEMYESSPFPRWVKPTISDAAVSFSEVLRQDGIELTIIDQRLDPESRVLVAGCGTGQQAIMVASRYPSSRITAVDLSLSSLAYAVRKTRECGISNIRYLHGDLLQLASLGERFDVIECVGVLHHMADPVSGWRVLVDVLKPGGIMKIGLYSERARQTIVKIRGQIASQGVASSPEQVRQLRQEVLAKASAGDVEMQSLMGIREFFNLNECVDLLFHVQEHRFSFLQIESIVKELGLRFLGLCLPDKRVMEQFIANLGAEADPKNLAYWDEYEQRYPDTFIGMYVFWVSK